MVDTQDQITPPIVGDNLRKHMFRLAVAELELVILESPLTGSVTVQCQDSLVRTIRLGGENGVIIWQDGVQKISILPAMGGGT